MYATAEKKELHDKTEQATHDVRQGARRIKDDMREAADNVKHDFEDIARQAGHEARAFVGSAEKNVAALADTMTTKISDNPMQSTAIALGVGLLIGLLFSRR